MAGREAPPSVEVLIGETRACREELHSFIERLRRDRQEWAARVALLSRRERLTAGQRKLFRIHLTRYRARGQP